MLPGPVHDGCNHVPAIADQVNEDGGGHETPDAGSVEDVAGGLFQPDVLPLRERQEVEELNDVSGG